MLPTRLINDARLFNDDPFSFLRQQFGRAVNDTIGTDYPVDVYEDDTAVHVEAELPGFTNDQVDVTLEQGVLTIHAKREAVQKPEGTTTHVTQRRNFEVTRRFTMPSTLDENNVDAKMEQGVLHLTLHKKEEVKPRKIEVK
jgi:HSP20 family protein